jgi:hypothetical protein
MAQAMSMLHERDPRDELWEGVSEFLGQIEPLGSGVVVAIYVRPEKLKSGLILSRAHTPNEDLYQGKVGLVLKLGPIAFLEDDSHRFGERTPRPGDWIVSSVGETFAFTLGKVPCRIVEDVSVRAIVDQPDIVL